MVICQLGNKHHVTYYYMHLMGTGYRGWCCDPLGNKHHNTYYYMHLMGTGYRGWCCDPLGNKHHVTYYYMHLMGTGYRGWCCDPSGKHQICLSKKPLAYLIIHTHPPPSYTREYGLEMGRNSRLMVFMQVTFSSLWLKIYIKLQTSDDRQYNDNSEVILVIKIRVS